MNRERLTILRDHLATVPDDKLNMSALFTAPSASEGLYDKPISEAIEHCGTAACVAGWTLVLFKGGKSETALWVDDATQELSLNPDQEKALFYPPGWMTGTERSAFDVIAAIQSMLDNPADDALPIWPEKAEAA